MADPGSLLFQGLSNFGSGVAQGFQNYTLMQQQDAAAQGQVNALLAQAQQTPGVYQSLSPDGQALLQKQLSGNANRQDRIKLLGEVSTAQLLAQNRQQLQLGQQQVQQGAMQNQMMQNRMGYLQSMMSPQSGALPPANGGPAPAQGQPSPPPTTPPPAGAQQFLSQPKAANYIAPPAALTINSPQAQAYMQKALQMTMGDPEKASTLVQSQLDAVNKAQMAQYQNAADATKDTGRLIYAGPQYEGGLPTMNLFNNEVVKGQGTPSESYTRGDKIIPLKLGVQPPAPVVFAPGAGMVNTQAALGSGNSSPEALTALAPVNANDPNFQKDVVAANAQANQDAQQVAEANALYKAAQAYTQGGKSSLNALRGDPELSKFKSLWTGVNPQGAFQTVLSANIHSVLAQMQSAAGTTIGGRMLGTEFNKTVDMLGNPQMDNPTILAAAKNNLLLNQRKFDLSNAYAQYHRSMSPSDAEELATQQYGKAPTLLDPGAIDNIPKPAISLLKANAKNPQVLQQFEQKYGPGTAELGLVAESQ